MSDKPTKVFTEPCDGCGADTPATYTQEADGEWWRYRDVLCRDCRNTRRLKKMDDAAREVVGDVNSARRGIPESVRASMRLLAQQANRDAR